MKGLSHSTKSVELCLLRFNSSLLALITLNTTRPPLEPTNPGSWSQITAGTQVPETPIHSTFLNCEFTLQK